MPITERQRELRRKHIGASDSPPILDVDEYRNIGDIFASKVYETMDSTSAAMEWGNRLETPILDCVQERLGCKLLRNQRRVSKDNPLFSASHDALIEGRSEGVEAKTVGILFPRARLDLWGDPDTDQIPPNVMIQVQHQMYVSDLDVVHVAALLGGRGFQLYHVPRDAEIIGYIVEAGELFWQNHVIPQIPPDARYAPKLATLKKIIRMPNKVAELSPGLVLEWQGAKKKLATAKADAEAAEAAMLAKIGDAEAGDYGDDEKMLTYFEQHRRGYEVKPTTYRVVRLTKRQKLLEMTNG